MKKSVFAIKPKIVIISIILLLILVFIATTFNRSMLDNWNPPQTMAGKWTGQPEVFGPFKKGISPSEYPEDWVPIEMVVATDGNVTGKVGQAELTDCKVKQNRNAFERLLGIKTDYIVSGTLKNGIVQDDTVEKRDISIPYNIVDGEMRGSIFEIEPWKYPYPLFPRLVLSQGEK